MRYKATILAAGVAMLAWGALTQHSAHAAPTERHRLQGVDAKEIYSKSCKECHGVIGVPTKASLRKYDKIPSFADPEFFKSKKESELLEAVEKGKGRDMKGFADKLSKEEIKAVVAYIETLQKK